MPGIELTDILIWAFIVAAFWFAALEAWGIGPATVGAALAAFATKALLLDIG